MQSFTTGFLMFWGGIAGMILVAIVAVVTFIKIKNNNQSLSYISDDINVDAVANSTDQSDTNEELSVPQTSFLVDTELMGKSESLDETILIETEHASAAQTEFPDPENPVNF